MNRLKISLTKWSLVFVILVFSSLLIISCDDDDDQGENYSSQTIQQIRNNMIEGSWSIVLYEDSGVNETNDYNGLVFTFNSDGNLVVQNSTQTYNGTWSVTEDDDSNTSEESDLDFNLAFSSPEILLEITDDWDIDSFTSTRIELSDISGGDGSTDLLTFEKN